MIQEEIVTFDTNSQTEFENYVNASLKEGWQILSTNVGFANSENYDFSARYMVILVKYKTT